MSAQLIFINDDDEPTTYRLDVTPYMPERDARIARALVEMVVNAWDHPQIIQAGVQND